MAQTPEPTRPRSPKTAAKAAQPSAVADTAKQPTRRSRVMQTDVPAYTLDDALRVPRAIGDNYAFRPTRPLDVAAVLSMQPTSGPFKMITGAAIAYGLTEGGAQADMISVLPLARRILRPTEEGDDLAARREALLRPRVIREFLTKYDTNPIPRPDIARNVLVSMAVPDAATERTFDLIVTSARSLGMLRKIKDREYVALQGTPTSPSSPPLVPIAPSEAGDEYDIAEAPEHPAPATVAPALSRRVYVTHGKNRAFIDPLKELLAFGEFDPVVSVERETVSQPVPEKVIGDMRTCTAAIIHVDDDRRMLDSEGHPHSVLNENVLVEIGAALALYGKRFILLVKAGVQLPSNLQGLYQVRYEGDKLDGEATIRLLKAINDIKNHPMP